MKAGKTGRALSCAALCQWATGKFVTWKLPRVFAMCTIWGYTSFLDTDAIFAIQKWSQVEFHRDFTETLDGWKPNSGWWFGTMEFYDFPYIGNVIIPTDFHTIIFQRGGEKPPASSSGMFLPTVAGFRIRNSRWGGPKKNFRRDCQCAVLWAKK